MARVPVSQPACPSCGVVLAEPPKRRKRCRACGELMYVRTQPADRERVIVNEVDMRAIDVEWEARNKALETPPLDFVRLFAMPLNVEIEEARRKSSTAARGEVPVRWVLGSWCRAYCRRIAGKPSCHDMSGEYPGGWATLLTVPAGDVVCHSSEEYSEWWYQQHAENEPSPCCDCHIEWFDPNTKQWDRA